MALQQKQTLDKIEILETGALQCRQRTDIYDDTNPSVIISSTFHRWVLQPGSSTTDQDPKIIAVANAVWTSEVVSAYQAQMAATAAKTNSGT